MMRRILACFAAVTALGIVVSSETACARDHEAVQAADASIGIETSQMFVTVENRAGAPLLDMTIAIRTPGAEFTHLVTRLEAGQKQDIPLSGFSSRDGTTFNLRFSRPRAVHASALDLTGKKIDAQVAWK
jgi:hypothetical protein